MSQKPGIPKGTRDFGPEKMAKRNFIFDTVKSVFRTFGFVQIETPTMENISTLTGKYGEEGDQLLYRVLNSGDFLSGVEIADMGAGHKAVLPKIAEKGLRYDLTVPFARFVTMNRNEVVFPFRRFQIQPVWRADRPQKGRYREFYQCDADVVGTEALSCEAELIKMVDEVLTRLALPAFTVKINNRKVLAGIAEAIGEAGKEAEICTAIDKLDKIGEEGVAKELTERGIAACAIQELMPILQIEGDNADKINRLAVILSNSETGIKGLEELAEVFNYLKLLGIKNAQVMFDPRLARGLSYYTGCIFEVKAEGVQMGSISGGGRYDNLTGLFGMPGVSGVGISFGVDRIYDVMEELNLFPASAVQSTTVLITTFDNASFNHGLLILSRLREKNIAAEIYPEPAKMKKQFTYANAKNIPFCMVIGEEEMKSGKPGFKNMLSGDQQQLSVEEVIEYLG